MTVARALSATTSIALLLAACTGGPGDLPGTDGGSGGQGGSSSGSSGGSSGGSSSGSSGTNAQIRASDFDQSCTAATDCVAVFEGQICSPCGCPNAAIAKKDLQEYASTRAAANCPQTDIACDACAAPAVDCAAGKCAIRR